ncbi:sugar-binding domain-containing protein [Streptomyces sp. NPDC052052]|uniref:glycoside hydrolase family 2 protein n=1 Tax=Streptomyces sp. NPDC052052 TaxID=3154756 RepID=UPI0034169386
MSGELLTRWGAALDPDAVLPEYPRPQLVRDSHLNLNGRWEYAIRDTEPAAADGGTGAYGTEPEVYDGEIIVPFSPEAPLSGVRRQLMPGHTLWYRRALLLPDGFTRPGGRVLLHFGAVDQVCRVLLNGVEVGGHEGGYLPFVCDLTAALREGENTLVVAVQDDTGAGSRGKQRLRRGGIWYTAQSGIWQTVWAECVPATYVERLTLVPRLSDSAVEVTVHARDAEAAGAAGTVRVRVLAEGRPVAETTGPAGRPIVLPVPDARLWTPEDPYLYDVEVELGEDRVTGYVGMRSFGVGPDRDGVPRLLLNGEPYFHAGVLDQGYWPDGLYTPPSDEAMVHDIVTMKELGFTMARKHIKVEPLRWYHHCDRLGLLVWQDMVNGGLPYRPAVITAPVLTPLRLDDRRHAWFGRSDPAGRARFEAELRETVEHLRSVTCLAVWVPFNEGWGQFDAARIAGELAELDPTRVVDHASGWHDQGAGDLRSLHVYFRRFRPPAPCLRRRSAAGRRPGRRVRDRRALVLSEYGGYSMTVDNHVWGQRHFGYKRFTSPEELAAAFARLHHREILPAVTRGGLSATVYTQLTDVEDEINGLLTYDRAVLKLPADLVRTINERLRLS